MKAFFIFLKIIFRKILLLQNTCYMFAFEIKDIGSNTFIFLVHTVYVNTRKIFTSLDWYGQRVLGVFV